MKRVIFVLLAACSVTLAQEPQRSAAPPAKPLDQPWLLGGSAGSVERLPDGGIRFPDGRVLHLRSAAFPSVLHSSEPVGTCYFIRTIKPMTDDAMRTGFIPIQGRMSAADADRQGISAGKILAAMLAAGQRGPDCTQAIRPLKAVATGPGATPL